jgi:hypothetical protein
MDQVEHLHTTRPHDRAGIAAAYDSIRQGMKIAEVHALLHIGDQLESLTQAEELREKLLAARGGKVSDRVRCVRAVGTFCELHNVSHWQADRAVSS